jgi:hypothetical protein
MVVYQKRVVVVVDPALGDKVAELRATAPVWVVNSQINAAAWGRAESLEPNSTMFAAVDQEARADNLIAQLDDIDLHFGVDSYPENPYVGIRVTGLALSDEVEAALKQYGFDDFRWADGGFEADLSLSARLRC